MNIKIIVCLYVIWTLWREEFFVSWRARVAGRGACILAGCLRGEVSLLRGWLAGALLLPPAATVIIWVNTGTLKHSMPAHFNWCMGGWLVGCLAT